MATRAYSAKQALVAVLEKHQGGPLKVETLIPEAQELAQLKGKTPRDTLGAVVSHNAAWGKPADKAKGLYFERTGVGEYQLAHEPHPTNPTAIAALAAAKGEPAPATEQEAAKQRVTKKRAARRAKSTTAPAAAAAASTKSPTRRQGRGGKTKATS